MLNPHIYIIVRGTQK